jgi:hypothetical protein
MAFNPLSLLILKFRGRSVAVFRDQCLRHEVSHPWHRVALPRRASDLDRIASSAQHILAVAQRNFRALHGVPLEDIVLLSAIPGYPDPGEVELAKDIWPTVSPVVHSVTIALESGAILSWLSDDDDAASDTDRETFFFWLIPPRNAILE